MDYLWGKWKYSTCTSLRSDFLKKPILERKTAKCLFNSALCVCLHIFLDRKNSNSKHILNHAILLISCLIFNQSSSYWDYFCSRQTSLSLFYREFLIDLVRASRSFLLHLAKFIGVFMWSIFWNRHERAISLEYHELDYARVPWHQHDAVIGLDSREISKVS